MNDDSRKPLEPQGPTPRRLARSASEVYLAARVRDDGTDASATTWDAPRSSRPRLRVGLTGDAKRVARWVEGICRPKDVSPIPANRQSLKGQRPAG